MFINRDGRCCSAAPILDFAMQLYCDGIQLALTSEDFVGNKTEDGCLYLGEYADVYITYAPMGNAVSRKISVIAKRSLVIRYFQTAYFRFSEKLSGGGEGQPVFAGDKCFAASLLPVSVTEIEDECCVSVEQSPWKELEKGERYSLYDVVFGFADGNNIHRSYVSWLRSQRRTVSGRHIYGDWSAHDDGAGETVLDEALALRLTQSLISARDKGVFFDSYLMDAFWYQENVEAPDFKESTWPNGIAPLTDLLQREGLQFGLWFDVSMRANRLQGDYRRLNGSGLALCQGCEENIRLIFSGIRRQLDATGAKLIKLDFADFECSAADHPHAPGGAYSKESAVLMFLSEIAALRRDYPELLILAYNTFTVNKDVMWRIDEHLDTPVISSMWCLYLDYLYCGDPRPAEHIPLGFPQSVISYTDSMIYRFMKAYMPPEAIDDHGTMIGNTNSIFYLGKKAFRDSWIMNIVRGNHKQHLYGELSLLDDDDWHFIAAGEALFQRTLGQNWTVEFLCSPLTRGAYAYSCHDADGGLVALVNPSAEEQTLCVRPDIWDRSTVELSVIYRDKNFIREYMGLYTDALVYTLSPGSVVLLEWCPYLKTDKRGVLILDGMSELVFSVPRNMRSVGFRVTDENGTPVRCFGASDETVKITGLSERQPDVPVWSGCSWISFRCRGGERLTVGSTLAYRVLLYWQSFENLV